MASNVDTPHTFTSGTTISSSQVNENFAAFKDAVNSKQDLPVGTAWSAFLYPLAAGPATDGHIATFTFSAPAAGSALVTAHFGVRVRNTFDAASPVDCHVQSLLSENATNSFTCDTSGCATPGYADIWVNGNLPTQLGGGTYLSFQQSASAVLPVKVGTNTLFLNGIHSCAAALWGPITISAIMVANGGNATLTSP